MSNNNITTIQKELDIFLEKAVSLRNKGGLQFSHSENLLEAANLFGDALNNYNILYNNLKCIPIYGQLMEINREHIRYEKFNSLMLYFHRKNEYDRAIENYKLAKTHIKKTLELISSLEKNLTDEISKDKIERDLEYDKNRWTYYSLQLEQHLYFVKADKEKSLNNLTQALDFYKKSMDECLFLMDKLKDYLPYLEPHYERLVVANYEMIISNYSYVKSMVLNSIDPASEIYEKILSESIKELWNAYKHTINSIRNFPEFDHHKIVAENQLKKINELLLNNKNHWYQIYLVMKDDNEFIANLKKLDERNYYMSINNENKSKTYKSLFSGIFFLISMIIIFSLLGFISKSISNLQFFLLSGVGIILFVLFSAVQLRVMDKVKEENFVKLIQLALDNYFKNFKLILDYFKKK